MEKERKIRILVDPSEDGITLSDVMSALVELGKPLSSLEIDSKKEDLKRAKRLVLKASALINGLKMRIKGEVANSVNRIAVSRNKNYRGNAATLAKLRLKQLNKNK